MNNITYPNFDISWLYREFDKFYMRETDINEHSCDSIAGIE